MGLQFTFNDPARHIYYEKRSGPVLMTSGSGVAERDVFYGTQNEVKYVFMTQLIDIFSIKRKNIVF